MLTMSLRNSEADISNVNPSTVYVETASFVAKLPVHLGHVTRDHFLYFISCEERNSVQQRDIGPTPARHA